VQILDLERLEYHFRPAGDQVEINVKETGMQRIKKVFGVLFAAAMFVAPTAVMAESASPTGDVVDFLAGTNSYDPSASGQKLFGTLTVVYSKETRQDCSSGTVCIDRSWVKNAFISLTMDSGNVRLPFTTDYLNGPPSHSDGFWLNTNRLEQVQVMLALVQRKVIPFFYRCSADVAGSCPNFKVKAINNFQYTTGLPLVPKDPLSGGFSADITIAVQ
jgi:hypothetical protein